MREEELKNRVATEYFGKYDCDRIVGHWMPPRSRRKSMSTDS